MGGKVEWMTIEGKEIASFDDHHQALIPWAKWACGKRGIRLITIDYHCDTQPAFMRAAFDGKQVNENVRRGLIAKIVPHSAASLEDAVGKLKHDEHIDAAVAAGIIDAAFIIAQQNQRSVISYEETAYEQVAQSLSRVEQFLYYKDNPRPTPPMTYPMPADRLVSVDPRYVRNGVLVSAWPDRVLESDYLDDRLAIFDHICRDSGETLLLDGPYILDIDLDAFNSEKAMRPDDPSTFHRLVQGAMGITIAREPTCFEMCWGDAAPPDVQEAERIVTGLIQDALK